MHIADRINEKYGPDDALRYLAATGGVLHRELPGVPVIVNVADWQLSCGRPNQSSCTAHDRRFRYETNAVLDQLHDSGYVDGFTISDNLKNNDLQAQRASWYDARKRWPAPFVLWSTCSQLSFPDNSFPGTADTAASLTQAFMAEPMAGGADGWALWAWHQEYDGAFYSFLDKDGSSNALWQAMVSTSRAELAGPAPSATPRRRACVGAPDPGRHRRWPAQRRPAAGLPFRPGPAVHHLRAGARRTGQDPAAAPVRRAGSGTGAAPCR